MKVFKNKKQRFLAVFLSLVFVMMLVPFTDVYASSKLVSASGGSFSFKDNDNPVYMVKVSYLYDDGSDHIRWYMISLSSFYWSTDGVGYNYCVGSMDATDFNGVKHYSSIYYYSTSGFDDSLILPPYYSLNVGHETSMINTYLYELLANGDTTGFDCSSVGGYDNEIGALKNVSRNILYPNGANNTDSVLWRFMYASKTTKGYNVKTAGTKIRVYESVTYYKRSDDSVYSEAPRVLVGEYDATSLQFDMDVNEAFNKTTSETEPDYIASAWTIVSKQIVRNDRIYLQVVSADGNHGDFLRIGGQSDNGDKNPQDVVDEDGNNISEEDGGYKTDDTDEKIGVDDNGDIESANDDANSKPDPTISIGGDLDSAISTFSDMLGMIGKIPHIIQKVFTFLPEWCLGFIGTFFVALCLLIIYKLVRG